jgi:hypothetical protein
VFEQQTKMMGLVYIFGVFLLFIGVWVTVNQLKLRRLRRQRQGHGFMRKEFVEGFRSLGISEKIPGTVFDYYTSQSAWKNFPLSPDDTYSRVLCDDPEDIDDDARALLEQLGMQFPPEYVRREYGDKPIKTLRDMVLWLDWMRQHQRGTRPNPTIP